MPHARVEPASWWETARTTLAKRWVAAYQGMPPGAAVPELWIPLSIRGKRCRALSFGKSLELWRWVRSSVFDLEKTLAFQRVLLHDASHLVVSTQSW